MPPKPRRAVEAMREYVPGKPMEDVSRELGLTDIVKLASNESPIGPSPKALEAIRACLANAHRYPEPTSRTLREAIARRWGVGPDAVFVGNGSDEIFRLLAETYVEVGDTVVAPAPSFSVYKSVGQLMGAAVVEVPLTDHHLDLERMARDAQHARLVFLCRPNNPTGTVFEGRAFGDFLEASGPECIVVLDEAYAEFDDSGFDSRHFLHGHPNLVISRTFSKAYGLAGVRLGYCIGHPSLLKPLFTVRDPFSVSRLAQEAGVAALEDEAHLEVTRDVVRNGRRQLYSAFEKLGLASIPSQANFILVELGDDAGAICDSLLRRGVIVRHTASFGLPRHARVSVGTRGENERFLRELGTILGK